MKIEFSHSAIKFLELQDDKTKSRIKEKLRLIKKSIEEIGSIPYKFLDIKSLSGYWYPYKRLRIGKIIILFIFWF